MESVSIIQMLHTFKVKLIFFVTNINIYLGLLLKLPLVAPEHLGFLSQGVTADVHGF